MKLSKSVSFQECWCKPVILAMQELGQEGHEFKSNLKNFEILCLKISVTMGRWGAGGCDCSSMIGCLPYMSNRITSVRQCQAWKHLDCNRLCCEVSTVSLHCMLCLGRRGREQEAANAVSVSSSEVDSPHLAT